MTSFDRHGSLSTRLRLDQEGSNPNTVSNFSQSWQRATQFRGLTQHGRRISVIDAALLDEDTIPSNEDRLTIRRLSVASAQPGYGTISAGSRRASRTEEALVGEDDVTDDEDDLDKEIIVLTDDEGNVSLMGKSTVPMTIFNCTNMLIGVGILALPLGFRECGWLAGVLLLTVPAAITIYTAKLLVRCLDTDFDALTYGDIAYLAFGSMGRHFVEIFFAFELIAANVALIILFADSITALIPEFNPLACKIFFAVGMIPLNFAPLRILSVSSAIGIFCFIGILMVMVASGLIKPDNPGSFHQLAATHLLPVDWKAIPASFGIFVAPWGGHSIVPAVYKDMRHPQKYDTVLKYTYTVTYFIAAAVGALGYLMFGNGIANEITSNILNIKEYPKSISVITLVLVTVIPLTKMALTNRPVMETLNLKFGVTLRHETDDSASETCIQGDKPRRVGRFGIGAFCNILQLALAILIPNFDDVVALMGSALCITICITLPGAFYLQIYRRKQLEISMVEKIVCWLLVLGGCICSVLGLVFAILKAP